MIDLDRRLERWVVDHRTEPLDWLFVFLSWIGSWGLVWIVIAALLAFVWKRPTVLPLTVLAEVLAEVSSRALKEAVGRERPHDHPLVHEPPTPSFPSGHATTSFACAATIARFVSTRVAVALYILAALVAWSRVYVGVHYPLDVVAGALLGLAIATALRPLPAILRRSPRAKRAG